MIKEVREDYTDKGRYDTGCEIPPSPRESLAFGRILCYHNLIPLAPSITSSLSNVHKLITLTIEFFFTIKINTYSCHITFNDKTF